MGKTKKVVEEKPVEEEVTKVASPVGKTKDKKKAKATTRAINKGYEAYYLLQLCKAAGFPTPNAEAMEIMEAALKHCKDNLIHNTSVLLPNGRTLTSKAVDAGFVQYLQTNGVPNETIKNGRHYADAAMEAIKK